MYDDLDSNIPSPTPLRKGGWRRFFLWAALAGGVVFILFLSALIALTVPNLRREVTPPEVSGAHRVTQSKNSPDRPTAPTSGTLSVSTSTSGTSPLNLDDFPHLSPTMRKMTQEWLDRCAETDRALAAIADPVLRAQAAELLKDRGNMRAFLNLPLEWGSRSYEEAYRRVWEWHHVPEGDTNTYLPPMPYSLYCDKDFAWGLQFIETCPEFKMAIGKEISYIPRAFERMNFELCVSKGAHWDIAAFYCNYRHAYFSPDRGGVPIIPKSENERKQYEEWGKLDAWTHEEWRKQYTWDEEVYCLRQMGVKGLPFLTVSSYQHALYTQTGNLQSPVYRKLQGAGYWAMNKLQKNE